MFQLREAVECQIARLLTNSLSEEKWDDLRRQASQLDKIPFEDSDSYRYMEVHYKFHLTLAETSGSTLLYRALERNNFLWLMCLQGQTKRLRSPESMNRHILLVDSLRQHDIQKAEDAMRQHVQYGLDGLIEDYAERK